MMQYIIRLHYEISELGSPPNGWHHKILPDATATEKAALAVNRYIGHPMGMHSV